MDAFLDHAIFEKFDSLVPVLIIALALFLFGLELFLKSNDIEGDTIKTRIRNWANGRYFYITFLWGVLTPQLFIIRKPAFLSISLLNRAVIVLAATSILLIVGQIIDLKIGQGMQAVLLLSGALTSYFLWPNYSLD